jgi:kynurenine formamidase
MIATINIEAKDYKVDLNQPIDISIPLRAGANNPSAWYVDGIAIEAVRTGDFTGSVKEGGSVNFRNISFNPHGNGTHTECLGHITPIVHSVNGAIKTFFSKAKLISIKPEKGFNDEAYSSEDDLILSLEAIKGALADEVCESIVIRTLPNGEDKKKKNWTESNWPQLDVKAAKWLADQGVKHLLIDLPSVDREMDGGKLLCHHAFWQVPQNERMEASISELIFVPDVIKDGEYLLELQFAPFENDASPSRPVLYRFL